MTDSRIIAGFARGRRKAIAENAARARELRKIVARLELEDRARNRPDRGRPGRIAEQLEGLVSRRHVARILDMLLEVRSGHAEDQPELTKPGDPQ